MKEADENRLNEMYIVESCIANKYAKAYPIQHNNE